MSETQLTRRKCEEESLSEGTSMAQHYKNDEITISRLKTFIGWENLNPKGNVAPGRMDQNVCGRLWENHQQDSIVLSKAESVPVKPLSTPGLLQDLKFAKAAVGDSFGPTWSTHLFRLDIEIQAAFEGKEVHLIWNSNSEAMVLNDAGHPRQVISLSAVRYHRIALNRV